ncbi:phosphoglycerate dehydrogenase-like enzyme [Thermocatellispora tengchongensis]|uniref:Phosphoglycerate dehydrogenase-like enzyme n=1 Tax=Thermocatellispora tengchongensis TaxID=1073253 RepID=A0A840PCM9_9ACTN|nr:hydroxyacid dehydrogenase [Thermocatellispora tengchongensis]MBB5133785.1 phosphoglycerate dehydrogenase-like enzyme [Thermocatellispora tengchongensis]
MNEVTVRRLFDERSYATLRSLTTLVATPGEAEIMITTWGSPPVDVAAAPRVRAVFHGAGSIRGLISDACWDRGIVVVSAAAANAVPVAEFTLASIVYAGKRIPWYTRTYAACPGRAWEGRVHVPSASNHRRVVGLVGLSRVGARVLELLRPFDFEVLVADPYAVPAPGFTLAGLDELLRRSDIVSLHAPLLPETRHMIDARRLALMPDGATLINTARGGLVDTDALVRELVTGRLHAILDVTDPEPLPPDSPLFGLPNVQLTPHISGSLGTETQRLGALVVAELKRYLTGRPLLHQVRREDLGRLA